eukprot:scaffold18936_cov144-Skeletonema_dohrnii-CCMP3373.AAC.1
MRTYAMIPQSTGRDGIILSTAVASCGCGCGNASITAAPAIKAGSQTYVSWFARFANTRKVVRQLTLDLPMTCETRDSDRSPKPLAHSRVASMRGLLPEIK